MATYQAFDADSLIRTSSSELAAVTDHAGTLAAVHDPKQEDFKAAYEAALEEITVLQNRLTLTQDTVKGQNLTINKLLGKVSTCSHEARELERLLKERAPVVMPYILIYCLICCVLGHCCCSQGGQYKG